MARYEARVVEIQHCYKIYVVEAKSEKEALTKLEIGDTINEVPYRGEEVVDRSVDYTSLTKQKRRTIHG